jgi:oxalate decarboxylase/phosphoglucose isomerase-like protein (cupin superfamily)
MDARQAVVRSRFALAELLQQRTVTKKPYLEFLRVPALSVGIYVLEAGATDTQSPHAQDEVYYVVSGKARMMLAEAGMTNTVEVMQGTIIFVSAGARHSFYNITERLEVLVFFAPAGERFNISRKLARMATSDCRVVSDFAPIVAPRG